MLEFEELIDRFDCTWRQSDSHPVIADFMRESKVPDGRTSTLLIEFIAIDLEYRWRTYGVHSGKPEAISTDALTVVDTSLDPARKNLYLEDFARDWPEYSDHILGSIDLISEEFRIRHRWGDCPSIENFITRFGDSEALRSAIESVVHQLQLECDDASGFEEEHFRGDTPDRLGTQFGRYRIVERIGRGGMGEVYLAEDTHLERRVALKMPSLDAERNARKRFVNESKAAANLHHPGICSVFDAGEVDGQPYITMAYIEGQTLREAWNIADGVSTPVVLATLAEVARAMQVAHDTGIIHRDLKPANIMIDHNGQPVVMDFGLAHRADIDDDGRVTRTGEVFGSPAYMSPEQVEATQGRIGRASDIYSLGTVLYECLAGRLPFVGPVGALLVQIARDEPQKPSVFRADIDEELELYCLQMLSKRPIDRPASMTDVADKLDAIRHRMSEAENVTSLQSSLKNAADANRSQPVPDTEQVRQLTSNLLVRIGVISAIVLALIGFGVFRYRVETPLGIVEIQVDDTIADRVQVHVKQNGRTIQVADSTSGWSMDLTEGQYEFELGTGREEFVISPRWVTVLQGQTELVSVGMKKTLTTPRSQTGSQLHAEEPIYESSTAPVHGHYLVQWKGSDGNSGEAEYLFRADHRVYRASRPIGYLTRRDGQWIIDFDPQGRGQVVLSHFTPSTFRGKHFWADGKTATWTANKVGTPRIRRLSGLNTDANEEAAWPSADGLRLYYDGTDDQTTKPCILLATRPNRDTDFARIKSVASSARHPSLTTDELVLVCLGGEDGRQLCTASRKSREEPFPTPQPIPEFRTTRNPRSPWVSGDGLTLLFHRDSADKASPMDTSELAISTRKSRLDQWSTARTLRVPGLASHRLVPTWPSLSDDELTLWFTHDGSANEEIWFAQRDSLNAPFEEAQPFQVDGKNLIGQSPRFCMATGELFYSLRMPSGHWDLSRITTRADQLASDPTKDESSGNYALHFTGARQYVETPVRVDETRPFTIEVWLTSENADGGGTVISNFKDGRGFGITESATPNPRWLASAKENSRRFVAKLWGRKTDRKPTHIATVWDGQQLRLYIDGKTTGVDQTASITKLPDFTRTLYMGLLSDHWQTGTAKSQSELWQQFHGMLDEVRISTIARYQHSFVPALRHDPDEHTWALYHCDENGGKTLIDASGNGNHGTITGGVSWVPHSQLSQPGQ